MHRVASDLSSEQMHHHHLVPRPTVMHHHKKKHWSSRCSYTGISFCISSVQPKCRNTALSLV